jgi:rhodanese-related sulfurtransferase
MDHSPGFLKVVNEVRPRIKEITVDEVHNRLSQNPAAILLDVREESEWQAGHAAEARHLGKGVLERDIEKMIPDVEAEIIMYCGGGFRSALACDVAQRMGYRNVASVIGGYKQMVQSGWRMVK